MFSNQSRFPGVSKPQLSVFCSTSFCMTCQVKLFQTWIKVESFLFEYLDQSHCFKSSNYSMLQFVIWYHPLCCCENNDLCFLFHRWKIFKTLSPISISRCHLPFHFCGFLAHRIIICFSAKSPNSNYKLLHCLQGKTANRHQGSKIK